MIDLLDVVRRNHRYIYVSHLDASFRQLLTPPFESVQVRDVAVHKAGCILLQLQTHYIHDAVHLMKFVSSYRAGGKALGIYSKQVLRMLKQQQIHRTGLIHEDLTELQ